MEKKSKIKLLGASLLIGGALILSSCNSFCSDLDKSNFLFAYDGFNTTFLPSEADGISYIKEAFKTNSNTDAEVIDQISLENSTKIKVSVYNETTHEYEKKDYSADLVFNTVNSNLLSIKPVTITATGVTKADDKGNRSDLTYTFGLNDFTKSLITSAASNGSLSPDLPFYEAIDNKTLDLILSTSSTAKDNLTFDSLYGYSFDNYLGFLKSGRSDKYENLSTMIEGRFNSILTKYGYLKFHTDEEPSNYYKRIEEWNTSLVSDGTLKADQIMSDRYYSLYKSTLNSSANNLKTCITVDDGFYGHINSDPLNDTFFVEGKGKDFYQGWGEAFSKHGFLEGLFVYPVATLVENLSHAFGMNGVGQIGAVIVTTLIVRLLFMLITMPSTLSQQKMTFLQPEIAKLQQRYPNANTNQYEKQKLAQAQMALYKKNKVHPFGSFIIIFIQFPIFISVWNALTGSASLSRDAVLGLRLSDTVWATLTNVSGWPSLPGWWTALVLILLMSVAQICAMFVPQWLNKRRMKNITKTGKSATTDQANKTMKITQWVMTGMIVLMGFNLPSAMGVYWFIGALISILQSLIIHFIMMARLNKQNKKGA